MSTQHGTSWAAALKATIACDVRGNARSANGLTELAICPCPLAFAAALQHAQCIDSFACVRVQFAKYGSALSLSGRPADDQPTPLTD